MEIPEWKRTGMTVVDEEALADQEKGVFRRTFAKAGDKISQTNMMKKIAESDDYKNFKKKYQGVKADAQDFSDKLRDQMEVTENRTVSNVRDVGTVLFSETS